MTRMKQKLPYLLLPFAVFTGYLLPRPEKAADSKSQTSAAPSRPNRPRSDNSRADTARIRTLAESLERSRSRMGGESPTVATADIPAVIAHLLSQAGPSGLSWETRSAIDIMLARWAKEDFDGALAWARSHPNRNAAKDFVEGILKERATTDFDSTLAIIRTLRKEDGLLLDLGQELFETAAKRGARQAFELLAEFPNEDSGSGGSPGDFPPGFDFQTFAELTSEHLAKATHGGGGPFEHFPTNVLEEWAKVDSSAALEFFLSSKPLPFNDLGDITGTFLNMAKPETAFPWIAEQYTDLTREQRARFAGNLNSVFPDEMGTAPLVELVNSLPDPTLRREMTQDMLQGFGGQWSNGGLIYIDLLSLLPTPAERLQALRDNGMTHSLERVNDAKLAELGITREQIKDLAE